jgi:hypothetical protein
MLLISRWARVLANTGEFMTGIVTCEPDSALLLVFACASRVELLRSLAGRCSHDKNSRYANPVDVVTSPLNTVISAIGIHED